jgi:hypothetical protein
MSVVVSVAVDGGRVHVLLLTRVEGVRLLVHVLHVSVDLTALFDLVILVAALS